MRIVSFLPAATEMLYALGLGRSVVGRSEHCLYPPAVQRKPVVVSSRVKRIARQDSVAIHEAVKKLKSEGIHQFRIDAKALQKLRPDLVITQNLCSVCAVSHPEISSAVEQLFPRPQVAVLQVQRLGDVFSELKRLGEITGRKSAADRLVLNLQKRLGRMREQVGKTARRPRVWCCEWMEPLMAAGHWVPEMIERAGGTDGLGRPGRNSRWLRWEEVRSYDPEIIVVTPCSYTIAQTLRERRRLTERPGWRELSAVISGRVFAVDGAYYHHAGPRLVNGIKQLAHLFHPDRVRSNSFKLRPSSFSTRLGNR